MFKRLIVDISKKIFSFLLLCSYLTNFVIAPVYASTDVMVSLPPVELQKHLHSHTYTQGLPSLKKPPIFDKEVNFRLSVKDASFGEQKSLFVSLKQGDQLLDAFCLNSDAQGTRYFVSGRHGHHVRAVQPLLGDSILGWSWDLSTYGLAPLQIGTNGSVLIDQPGGKNASCCIAAPSIHVGTCKLKHMQLQSSEVVIHKDADIDALEIEPSQRMGRLIISQGAFLTLKGLSFHGDLLNLGDLCVEHDPTDLRLQNSTICNWGTIRSATDLRLAGLGLFENFGQVAVKNFTVRAVEFLNHKTITASLAHIFAQNLMVNDVGGSITGTTALRMIGLGDMINSGSLKGGRTRVVSQQFTGQGHVIAADFKFFTHLWDGQGQFKAATIKFDFKKLLAQGEKASFEAGSRLSLASDTTSTLRLATLKGDHIYLSLSKADLSVDKLDFAQSSTLKAINLTLKEVIPGFGVIDWQAERILELPFGLVRLQNNGDIRARILRFHSLQSPKTLKVATHTLMGKSMSARNLDVTFAAVTGAIKKAPVRSAEQQRILDAIGQLPRITAGDEQAFIKKASTLMENIMEQCCDADREVLLDALSERVELITANLKRSIPEENLELKRFYAWCDRSFRYQLQKYHESVLEMLIDKCCGYYYEYAAQQELKLTHTGELFANKGHLQGNSVITKGKRLHNFGTIVAKQKTQIDEIFVNAEEGIIDSPILELSQLDHILSNAGKITVRALQGVDQIQNTGHLEIHKEGLRLRVFYNTGYAELGRGLWFFEDFTNMQEAVCKLGKRSEIVQCQNLGALYVDSGLRVTGRTPENLGRLIVNGRTVWDVLPGHTADSSLSVLATSPTPSVSATIIEELKSAVSLSNALKAEDAYLTDVSKTNPVAGFIGFLTLSEAHSKHLFTDFAKEPTKAQWLSVLSRLNHAHDPLAVIQLLDRTKTLLWDQRETLIGPKALKDYLDIATTITASDEAMVELLTGTWGLDYLKGVTGEDVTSLNILASKIGTSFYQQQRTIKEVYKTVYDNFAKHRLQSQALNKTLLQKHFVSRGFLSSAPKYLV